jgi:hypothetical protein
MELAAQQVKRHKTTLDHQTFVAAQLSGNVRYAGRPPVPQDMQQQRTCCEAVLGGHANEIVPRLYLGSEDAAAAPMEVALRERDVRMIVNCTFGPCVFEKGSGSGQEAGPIKYVCVGVRDEDSASILPYLSGAADLIQQQLRGGGSAGGGDDGDGAVLVHCQRGVSRSATVVIAYLMKHRGMSRDDAYVLVKGRRPLVDPNIGFWEQLADFGRSCRVGMAEAAPATAVVFDEEWSRKSLAEWSMAPAGLHAFVDVAASVAEPSGRGREGAAAMAPPLAERRRRALRAGLELCLSRASCAAGCVPEDVRWLCALCGACDGGGGSGDHAAPAASSGWARQQLRECWEAELRENWESDFSHAKFCSLADELAPIKSAGRQHVQAISRPTSAQHTAAHPKGLSSVQPEKTAVSATADCYRWAQEQGMYISQDELAMLMRSSAAGETRLLVVDVRDDDNGGGSISGAVHHPDR